MARVIQTFSLDTEEDSDLITWLGSIQRGERSAKIRDVLREVGGQQGTTTTITLDTIYQLLQDMRADGVVVTAPAENNDATEYSPEVFNCVRTLLQQGRA